MIRMSIVLAIFLTGCTSLNPVIDRGDYYIDTTHTAVSQNERVRFLVFHYTALDDAQSLDVLARGSAASAHYLLPTIPAVIVGKPVVLRLVNEDKRAWHAGLSDWGNRSNLNDTSIGIEIVNPGFTEEGDSRIWYSYRPEQIDLLARLSRDIIDRYSISPDNVLGHSDIAPMRKSDPGLLFPWKALAEQGIGAWPDVDIVEKYLAGRAPKAAASVASIQAALAKYGYAIPQTGILDTPTRAVLSAFQMHFRAADMGGDADAETEAIALALIEKYKAPDN